MDMDLKETNKGIWVVLKGETRQLYNNLKTKTKTHCSLPLLIPSTSKHKMEKKFNSGQLPRKLIKKGCSASCRK